MAVTAALVKELRRITGAGMMDCKNVLLESDGDMDRAAEALREKGLAKAAKKAGRVASEGLVRVAFSPDHRKGAIVEVNSETDFVAKNEEFIRFVETLSSLALETTWTDLDSFLAADFKNEGSLKDAINAMIAKIGENLNVRRLWKSEKDVVHVGYLHGGGKIGVIVGLETEASYEDVFSAGKDIAMQVASMNPGFIDESQIDPEYIKSEKKILIQQALNEGKPADLVEKVVAGRLKKELREVCLLEQKFVKSNEITVKQYIEQAAKDLGKSVKVVEMIRYEVGEGVEKKSENFAEEVAKQIGN
jgi:elongation factor Ts